MVNESTRCRWKEKKGIAGYAGNVLLDPIKLTPSKGEYPSVGSVSACGTFRLPIGPDFSYMGAQTGPFQHILCCLFV